MFKRKETSEEGSEGDLGGQDKKLQFSLFL
jgi:hypothetical protein